MVKLMSVLEKYNLVEKTNPEIMSEDMETASTLSQKTESVSENKSDSAAQKAIPPSTPFRSTESEMTPLPKDKYDNQLSLQDIYDLYQVSFTDPTDTVFMLENLIKALPENLSQDVLKTTVKNVMTVSHMDLNKLLQDGEHRLNILVELMNDYYTYTNNEIAGHRAEISKLTSVISQLQDKIKAKESLLKDQTQLVQSEAGRIEKIVDFFRN